MKIEQSAPEEVKVKFSELASGDVFKLYDSKPYIKITGAIPMKFDMVGPGKPNTLDLTTGIAYNTLDTLLVIPQPQAKVVL